MEMDLHTQLRIGESLDEPDMFADSVNTPSNSCTTMKSPGHHQMEKPNESLNIKRVPNIIMI